MPKVLVFCGRPLPPLNARRISFLLVALSLFAVASLIFTLPNGIPAGPSLSRYTDHKFSVGLPNLKDLNIEHHLKNLKSPFSAGSILNPFRAPSHPPARQKNDTFEESSWWADWRWLVPFSSSLTLDEDRSLLPVLVERTPIYCYYDATVPKRDSAVKDAESALLLTWRMAWWAKGFKPIILSSPEAMNNPLYETLQHLDIGDTMRGELMRWLAWDNMGGGLLSHYTLLPMGAYEDPLITYLRRGEYPSLTKWDKVGNGLFAGSEEHVTAFVKLLLDTDPAKLHDANGIFSVLVPQGTWSEDLTPRSLSYYEETTFEKEYPKIAGAISADRARGLASLNELINAHLHVMWQNAFEDGISVLNPLPQHSNLLIADAWRLAHLLARCPHSPLPESCPPSFPKCKPCSEEHKPRISIADHYRNDTTLFTIGTVPHPYTLATLHNMKGDVDVAWIRREMRRDPWVTAATAGILGAEMGSEPRVVHLKEAIAADGAHSHSMWLTAEKEPPSDLSWHFGFALPYNSTTSSDEPTPPPPSVQPGGDDDSSGGEPSSSSPADADREQELFNKALILGVSTDKEDVRVRDAVEAWNLADTEAWKFARAYLARWTVERMTWEEEESRYIDGAGSEDGIRSWSRWLDKLDR